MAIIAGVTVNWKTSPRIITFPVAETEVSVEDIQDTLINIEDTEEGVVFPKLRNTSGGEALGGGVTVGWTMELANAQIAFAPRTTNKETGTVTTPDTSGIWLEDSAASFITNGVVPGDSVINFTDQSATTVIEVVSETRLQCYALSDGTDNQWDLGDSYKVWPEDQCEATGGNLVAVDGVGSSISSIFPTFGTQVLKTSSSSATTQNQEQLQTSTFIGKEGLGVAVSPTTGTDSTVYPTGTREFPCKTEANFHGIAAERGFHNVYVMDSISMTGDHSVGHIFFGDNPQTVNINCDVGSDVSNCKFTDCYLTGKLDTGNIIWESIVGSITNANGFIYQSTLLGPIVFSADTSIERCWTAPSVITGEVVLDFNGLAIDVQISSWGGGRILIKNMVTGSNFTCHGDGGDVRFDNTNTGGTVRIYPGWHYHDENGTWNEFDDHTIGQEVWARVIDSGYTAEEVMKLIASATAAKLSGADTATISIRDLGDTKDRIIATTDASGNRTAVVHDVS